MKTALALLLALPLLGCEPDSVMESSAETLEQAGDEIAVTLEAAKEDVEDGIDKVEEKIEEVAR